MTVMTPESNVEDRLNSLFGDYKAEWLQDSGVPDLLCRWMS